MSFRQYTDNVRLKKAVERSLQVAVEVCLDIGRRLIVHDYAKIDDVKVYQLLKTRLDDFDAFADAVSAYLKD
jgi:uncharacterized protein YutE (UPF0331/DUF86 family)